MVRRTGRFARPLVSIFIVVGSVGLALAGVFASKPSWSPRLVFLVVGACLFCLVAVCIELYTYWTSRPQILTDKESIRQYLCEWIKGGDRVLIVSRDLSWVNDEETHELLLGKARRHELDICVPERTELVTLLEENNATVHTYSTLSTVLTSRFTVRNWGTGDAQVTTGMRLPGKKLRHVNQEFSASDAEPAFQVFKDLAESICRLPENQT